MVSTRPARMSDAEGIAHLTTQLGYEVHASSLAARLARILSRSDQLVLAAEIDGRLVGWVHAAVSEYIEAEPFVIIGGLVVDVAHRRRGIGRMLMDQAEQWARSQDCSIVRLWSSTVRTAAHSFYERLGYTNIKTQYVFIKSLRTGPAEDLKRFVPRVDP